MVDLKELQKMLLDKAHDYSEEEKEFMKILWDEYKEDKQELKEINHLIDYNEEIKKELHAAFEDMHNNKLRKSAEELNTLRGKINHSRLFINHLEKEREKRPTENARIIKITHKLNNDVILMLKSADELVKKVVGVIR
ncbi:MAG: hypothetical protein JSW73_02030 [Candidatus Woesearchaeota archaeon]|nr:MAG: hypothetical protein JSW73_02030 [Candidatus Woesearchaeota archaeon]